MDFLPLSFGLVLLGLILLFFGGEMLVKGAVSVAKKLNLSEVFIGIVIIGFGTSLPETLTVFEAAQLGDNGLALGNIVGSNIANIALILGVALVLAKAVHMQGINKERINYALMAVGLLIFTTITLLTTTITWTLSGLLIACMIVLMIISWRMGKSDDEEEEESILSWPLATGAVLLGFVLLIGGAKALVTGATAIATAMGVPELIIGLTLVALGTSLPELAATIAAARHGKLALTVGNVLGSNLFNVLIAVGLGALGGPLSTIGLTPSLIIMWVMSLLMLVLFLPKFKNPKSLGIVLLIGYVAYLIYLTGNMNG